MITKILAAKRAAGSGASTVIAWGREPDALVRLSQGEAIGTLLVAQTQKQQARKQWMADQLQLRGSVTIDDGAVQKLKGDGSSLLPIGMITVDGDFSRGEVIAILDGQGQEVARGLANYAAAEARLLCRKPSASCPALGIADRAIFEADLTELCIELAKKIPDDGEGATHLIEIHVRGANVDADADAIARSIALSNLVKTAITGGDPNWGRIVSAAGYAGVPIHPNRTALWINGLPIFAQGEPLPFDAKVVSESIRSQKLTLIELEVGLGPGEAVHWTTDLNTEYVRFNSEYTT
jgi:hypothetical protein